MVKITEDRRALLAAAVVFVAIPMIFPSSMWPPILLGAVVAGLLTILYWSKLSNLSNLSEDAYCVENNNKRKSPSSFAPIDPSLYTLRMPLISSIDISMLRKNFKHLYLRKGGSLAKKVHKAVVLGSRNGNNGSGTKAIVTLEDFFIRYHRALVSSDPDLAKRTLEVLRDTRVVALNAIEDLAFTVPIALSKPIRIASEAARTETLECMSTLAMKHAPALSPGLSASMSQWASPRPNDPRGVIGDPHSLY